MVKQYKIDRVQELTSKLQEKKNIILTNYSGTKVSSLTALRNKLRAKGIDYKVVKNNLFRKALKDTGYPEVDDFLKGPIGVVFVKDDLSEAAKILKDFKKEQEKFSFTLGIMDNVVYNGEQVKKIADIPSKEVLIAQIMSLINSGAANLAMVVNQTIASVPRGVKAVAEKNAV
ncbi:MAG: 50S ribosomal protein L10 [Spirochaetota bacterium]